ncbi:unnamed protein product [Cylicostephanus goldi]|uniref:Uncharacterized protein n=1 Tax=Cylicostephanus goldi TaxID=71465 RepID=A0A3P7PTG1_CYLGO|nr:unnamed protein product [Cylicostephanus goldi]
MAIHAELASCFDTYFVVEDVSFWTQVAPLVRLEGDYNVELPGMVSRVYMREESPWVLSIVVVPTNVDSIEALDAVPLLFCLCDEPMLAVDLARRRPPKSPRVLDRRFSTSPSARVREQEKQPGKAREVRTLFCPDRSPSVRTSSVPYSRPLIDAVDEQPSMVDYGKYTVAVNDKFICAVQKNFLCTLKIEGVTFWEYNLPATDA